MSDTFKRAGESCPKCHGLCPAEYAQKGQKSRWSCVCGAGGELIGQVAGASGKQQQAAGKTVHPAPQGILRSRT